MKLIEAIEIFLRDDDFPDHIKPIGVTLGQGAAGNDKRIVLTREMLLSTMWGYSVESSNPNLVKACNELIEALGQDSSTVFQDEED